MLGVWRIRIERRSQAVPQDHAQGGRRSTLGKQCGFDAISSNLDDVAVWTGVGAEVSVETRGKMNPVVVCGGKDTVKILGERG